ncbi:sensor domain-containing diguanylate cyclase [Pseudomonas sp. PvP001]|uniref:sensor domain-containing diguanylate cyclase n=1 Tax=Pseudomonas sp. PvP001 TaxID=3158559 RepID=UPI003398C5FB
MPGRNPLHATSDESAEPLSRHAGRNSALFRLTVTFIVLVIFTFTGVEGWRAWRDYQQAFATARDSVTNLARATAQHAEDAIRQVDVLTDALAERVQGDGLQNMDVPRIHALMQQQARIMPQLHGLFIYDASGQWVVTDKTGTPEAANNADRDYFNYHRTHTDPNVRISDVVRSRSTDEYILPISRRLNNPDGSFAGVLLGTIRVSYFVDYYGDFKIDDRGALVLALRNGRILVRRPFLAPVLGKTLEDSEIFKRYLPVADEGVVEVKAVVDNTYRLYAYRALSSYPLVVEAGLSRESYIGPWRRDLLKTGLVLLVLIAGLSGFGMIVLKQLRERIAIEEELRQAHQIMRDMALTDSLSGLGNRRRLDMALGAEIGRARRQHGWLALIMLDVDYFKRYNDRYGHAAGDRCLRQVADAIVKVLKRPTDLAVRYGGEEFTVLLPGTDLEGAGVVAEAILQAIRDLGVEHLDHPAGHVTVSAGITAAQPAVEWVTAAQMLITADACLYTAKHKGRNRWHACATQGGT